MKNPGKTSGAGDSAGDGTKTVNGKRSLTTIAADPVEGLQTLP